MNRESDEECLAQIATIRARKGETEGLCLRSETERLLGNLEARIEERAKLARGAGDPQQRLEVLLTENARLRGQLADLGTEFVKLTVEVERLHAECEQKDIALSCSSLRAPEDERQAQADLDEDCAKFANAVWAAEAQKQGVVDVAHPAIRFRDVIREEVRKEVQSEGAAEACRQHVREEVAAEVGRQLVERVGVAETVWTWINNVQHELDKLRAALEAKAS